MLFQRAIYLAGMIVILLFSCHKKNSKDDPASTTTPSNDPIEKLKLDPTSPVAPQLVTFTYSVAEQPSMVVAGQLVLDTSSLTDSKPDRILAVPLYRGLVSVLGDTGNFKDIQTYDVAPSTGRFTVEFSRVDPYLEPVNELLAMTDDQLTQEAMYSKIPLTVVLGSGSNPDAATRTLLETVKAVCESGRGRSYMLVGMTASPDDVEAEAASMRFIGMPTGESNLTMLFPPLAKGHILYGDVKIGAGDDIRSSLSADDSVFNLPSNTLSEIASVSGALKGMKNAYMNYNAVTKGTAIPEMVFEWTAKGFAKTDAFIDPDQYVYQGFGTRVRISNVEKLTVENLCNAKTSRLKLYPPKTISLGTAGNVGPDAPFGNAGSGSPEPASGGGQGCNGSGEIGFEANVSSIGSNLIAEIGWGGNATGDVPEGLWRLTFDDELIARFDVGTVAPIGEGVTRVPVPVFAIVVDSAEVVTSLDIKFYFQNADKTWSEITDLYVLDQIGMVYESGISAISAEANHLFEPTKVGNVLRFSSDKFKNVVFTAPGSTQGNAITAVSISYDLFGQHYRFQLRVN